MEYGHGLLWSSKNFLCQNVLQEKELTRQESACYQTLEARFNFHLISYQL